MRQSRWSSQEVGEVSNGQEERSHKGANQLSTDQMLVLLSHKGQGGAQSGLDSSDGNTSTPGCSGMAISLERCEHKLVLTLDLHLLVNVLLCFVNVALCGLFNLSLLLRKYYRSFSGAFNARYRALHHWGVRSANTSNRSRRH